MEIVSEKRLYDLCKLCPSPPLLSLPSPSPFLPAPSPSFLPSSQCINALLLNAPYARLSEPYQTRIASSLKPLLSHRSEYWSQMYVHMYYTVCGIIEARCYIVDN